MELVQILTKPNNQRNQTKTIQYTFIAVIDRMRHFIGLSKHFTVASTNIGNRKKYWFGDHRLRLWSYCNKLLATFLFYWGAVRGLESNVVLNHSCFTNLKKSLSGPETIVSYLHAQENECFHPVVWYLSFIGAYFFVRKWLLWLGKVQYLALSEVAKNGWNKKPTKLRETILMH